MGGARRIVLSNGKEFAKQKAAIEFFREILGRYKQKPGDRINEEDSGHLRALLERHVDRKEKVGCGVDHFFVSKGEEGTDCFYIVHKCGKRDHFSYLRCIDQKRS